MGMLCCLFLLVVQLSANAAHSHKGSQGAQGLSCVNDFVSSVSCTWNRALHQLAPGVDCWIFGVKKTWVLRDMKRHPELIMRSCKLRHHRSSPPGCSFAFEPKEFNAIEVMPNISMECNGTLVENLTHYKPVDHIKMRPPGLPSVNATANYTWISWSPGAPLSKYITSFDFQVQVTEKNRTWKDAHLSSTQEPEMKLLPWQVKGICQVRVRVRSSSRPNSHWSDWSLTASWMGAADAVAPQDHDWFWAKRELMLSVALVVLILVLYGSCVINGWFRRLKGKPVPTPSRYFHTLHSVHKGNLKKWMNPVSASEAFFTTATESPDHISPVEVCESWDAVPSTSPCSSSSSSTSVLLHFHGYPSADSDTSGIVDNFSSSSSSYFYNMGYFMSASSSSSAQTDPSPAYFAYRDDFSGLKNSLKNDLHVSFCPSFAAPLPYEALKREPQSPDSGLGIEKEDEEDVKAEREADVGGEEVSDDPQRSPGFNPLLHLLSQTCLPPLSHAPGLNQISSDCQQVDVPAAAAGGDYAAWPMCRSSSMPVEPCKTGYLTLKELQTTFSNKSI